MSYLLAIALLFLPTIVGMTNVVTAYEDNTPFKIAKKLNDDKVEVEEGKAYFSVHSPFGISQ